MTPPPVVCTIPPARVAELWNSICERNWTLQRTLEEFARLILAEAESTKNSRQDAPGRDFSGAVVSQHPPDLRHD